MKTRFFYLATMVMALLIMSACNNEDDFSDIVNEGNLITEKVEIFELERDEVTYPGGIEFPSDTVYYSCYEKKSELGNSYSIDATKLFNWNNRTLVIAHVFYHSKLYGFSTKVSYQEDGKYVIELLEKGVEEEGPTFRFQSWDKRSFGIILDKPSVSPENIQLKVGILKSDYYGKRSYNYIEVN